MHRSSRTEIQTSCQQQNPVYKKAGKYIQSYLNNKCPNEKRWRKESFPLHKNLLVYFSLLESGDKKCFLLTVSILQDINIWQASWKTAYVGEETPRKKKILKKKVNLKIQIPSYKYIYGVKKKNTSGSKVSDVHLNCVRSHSQVWIFVPSLSYWHWG